MNRGGDSILSVYSDARAEYTKQLCIFLVPAYFQFFLDLLERAKQEMAQEPKRMLWQFQTYLNDIHDWNMEKVSQEIHRIHNNSGCDYLEDLLTAVFIAHTKVLTAIRLGQHQKKVEINIPKVDHFLFKVLCETAKLLWGSSYLFREGISSMEKQQNYRVIEGMLNEGILQAVRTLVPVKSILKDFVHPMNNGSTGSGGKGTEGEDEDSDDEETAVTVAPPPPVPSAPSTPLPSTPPALPVPPALPTPLPSTPSVPSVPLTPLPSISLSLTDPLPELPELPETLPTPTIVLNEKPNVRFGQFNSVFDMDHPNDSDLIYDPKESDTDENPPDLEILEQEGTLLGEDDMDPFDADGMSTAMEEGDFEVLP